MIPEGALEIRRNSKRLTCTFIQTGLWQWPSWFDCSFHAQSNEMIVGIAICRVRVEFDSTRLTKSRVCQKSKVESSYESSHPSGTRRVKVFGFTLVLPQKQYRARFCFQLKKLLFLHYIYHFGHIGFLFIIYLQYHQYDDATFIKRGTTQNSTTQAYNEKE